MIILYICLIVFCNLLFMNLFVGVIMGSYGGEKEKLDMVYKLKKPEKYWL